MRPTDVPLVVVLRRALTPQQRRVLALMADAPSYALVGEQLGIAACTVEMHVQGIADVLPATFLPDARTKERVIIYAIRVWALAEIAKARDTAA